LSLLSFYSDHDDEQDQERGVVLALHELRPDLECGAITGISRRTEVAIAANVSDG
jgi:hypothetical protein